MSPQKKPFVKAYHRLYQSIGSRNWWPARSPFEVMLGAILTQNTSWRNVEKSIEALRQKKLLSPRKIKETDLEELSALIRSSGYYRQKALKLKALVEWFGGYRYSIRHIRSSFRGQEVKLREELLGVFGIGPETADSILCYAFELPFFVVDAYTFRWLQRYIPEYVTDKYEVLRKRVEREFRGHFKAAELSQHFNEFHALLVYLGKYFCKKRKPLCFSCPLERTCKKNVSEFT